MSDKCTCFEANFELASSPIEVNLELPVYSENIINYVELYYDIRDWTLLEEENIYIIRVNPNDYNFSKCSLSEILVYDNNSSIYISALGDYQFDEINKELRIYSDNAVKCKVIIFGPTKL